MSKRKDPSEKKKGGRVLSLTPELSAKICTYLRAGEFLETATWRAGVSINTVRQWLTLGRKGEEPYAQFDHDVNCAIAEGESADLAIIGAAAETDWRAAAWRLERRAPKRYGMRIRMSVEEAHNELLDALERALDPEAFERVLKVAVGLDSETEAEPDRVEAPSAVN